jgi:large subunit ribosomal protein L24
MARIRKGDTVAVLSGKDRGKTGKVIEVWPQRQRALVEHVNMLKHFDRRSQQNQAGGVIDRESPIHLSKLAPFCPKCRKPARVGWSSAGQGEKKRTCRRCKELLS